MKQEIKAIKVFTPDNGKCLKISQKGKIITYLKESYIENPNYNYTIEEVNIEEADKWFKRSFNKVKNVFKFLR